MYVLASCSEYKNQNLWKTCGLLPLNINSELSGLILNGPCSQLLVSVCGQCLAM